MYRYIQIFFVIAILGYSIYLFRRPSILTPTPKPILWTDIESGELHPKPSKPLIYSPQVKPFDSGKDTLTVEKIKEQAIAHAKRFNLPNPFANQPVLNTPAKKPEFRIEGCKPILIPLDSAKQAQMDSARIIGPSYFKK